MLKETNDKTITDEGERMVPSYHKGAMVYGEHISRYDSITPLVKGKDVLDIASGSGYGSYIIGESAKSVVGVEIDKPSVAYAKRNYSRPNVSFVKGSAESIPQPDNNFDVVVSFETIEHIKNYKKFVEEVKRILKTDGVFIVSTPNDLEFPEGNHFHLHEFTEDELKSLLKKYFKHVEVTYQYTWLYTALMDAETAATEKYVTIETANVAPVGREKAIYFTMICSDKPIKKPATRMLGAISEHYSARKIQQDQAVQEDHTNELKKRLQESETSRKEATTKLDEIYRSKGWKALTVVYTTKHKLSSVIRRR